MQLFNVMEPAAETPCDSCSLLKICTRELFFAVVLSVSAQHGAMIDGRGAGISSARVEMTCT